MFICTPSLMVSMYCKKDFFLSLQKFLIQQTIFPETLQDYLLQCRRFQVITKKDIEFFNSPVPRNCQFIFEIIDSVTHEIIQCEPIPGQPCFSRFCGTPCTVQSYSTYLLFWQYFAAMAQLWQRFFLRKHYAVLMVFVVESSFVTIYFSNLVIITHGWLLSIQLSKIHKNQDILLGKLAKNEKPICTCCAITDKHEIHCCYLRAGIVNRMRNVFSLRICG